MVDENCTGYSVSKFGNCLIWFGKVKEGGVEWGDAQCFKKLDHAKAFTYMGEGWCRGPKDDPTKAHSDKRVLAKVRDDMSFTACMMECFLEYEADDKDGTCLGFAIALAGTEHE